MCGRYTLTQSAKAISEYFGIPDIPNFKPQYNIAPTQLVLAVLHGSDSDLNVDNSVCNKRILQQLRWGLIPPWAKDKSMGAKLINARSETVAEKPSFRAAFKRRRCLLVTDGFYEWQRQDGKQQPFYFRLQNQQLFAFAGLWEQWQSPEGEQIKSCTILTAIANEMIQPIHERMPVILQPEDYDLWLDVQVPDLKMLKPLLQPLSAESMTAYPVSALVNNVRNNHPECIMPV
ncbi:SOS response-associated peptidase [Calothrix sp. UHCC 0171]|uniref:SOS response-associated peptidase n=1 Tax=Calothrix sp. UHCC 0171 TaxID=3110245 RepID=UPI002B2034F8|nr:SOS response-associated peptidase [Calothrix sp. UHCC 0171]MEA5573322.1 SOS response-associated peptidase [Calothrix sp. UHCC 0171]